MEPSAKSPNYDRTWNGNHWKSMCFDSGNDVQNASKWIKMVTFTLPPIGTKMARWTPGQPHGNMGMLYGEFSL